MKAVRSLVIDGTDTATAYGAYVIDGTMAGTPQRTTTAYQIPGRSGDVILDSKRYNNRQIKYTFSLKGEDVITRAQAFCAFLAAESITYHRVIDQQFSDTYMLMRVTDTISPTFKRTRTERGLAVIAVTFDAKPHRYLIDGDNFNTYSSNATISNPYSEPCYPLLRTTGTVTIGINEKTISVTNSSNLTVYIDTERLDAYTDTGVNFNDGISLSTYSPESYALNPGNNTVSIDGASVAIAPRYRTI